MPPRVGPEDSTGCRVPVGEVGRRVPYVADGVQSLMAGERGGEARRAAGREEAGCWRAAH